jgi:hypothetical protein
MIKLRNGGGIVFDQAKIGALARANPRSVYMDA